MILDVSYQARHDMSLQPLPVKMNTGSVLPLEITGIPERLAGERVTAVTVVVTNPDGVSATGAAEKAGDVWRVKFAASIFAAYGMVLRGVKIMATTAVGTTVLALADLVVVAATADAIAGNPGAHYQTKDGDMFFKSEVVDGVQHFKRITIAYNEALGAWGYNDPEGDYILDANGDFIAVN